MSTKPRKSKTLTDKKILKILDVNFNRALEACRVIEETVRIGRSDARFRKIKNLRHRISDLRSGVGIKRLAVTRSDGRDPGASRKDALEKKYKNSQDLTIANIQRLKESLRVIEEAGRVVTGNGNLFGKAKRLRFQAYEIEEKILTGK